MNRANLGMQASSPILHQIEESQDDELKFSLEIDIEGIDFLLRIFSTKFKMDQLIYHALRELSSSIKSYKALENNHPRKFDITGVGINPFGFSREVWRSKWNQQFFQTILHRASRLPGQKALCTISLKPGESLAA